MSNDKNLTDKDLQEMRATCTRMARVLELLAEVKRILDVGQEDTEPCEAELAEAAFQRERADRAERQLDAATERVLDLWQERDGGAVVGADEIRAAVRGEVG